MTEYLPYFNVKFKIKNLPASWLSIAFFDTDLMLQVLLALQNRKFTSFKGKNYIPKSIIVSRNIGWTVDTSLISEHLNIVVSIFIS